MRAALVAATLAALCCTPEGKKASGALSPGPAVGVAPAVDAGPAADAGSPGDAGDDEGPLRTHLRPAPQPGKVVLRPDGVLTLTGHRESILALAFDPTGTKVATGGLDRSVRLWDLTQNAEVFAVGGNEEAITVLKFSPKADLLAAGDRAYQVRLLDVSDGHLVRAQAHPDPISDVAFSPDGKWLAVAGSGGNADVYPVAESGPSKCELRGRTVAFTDRGSLLVTGAQSGLLTVTTFPGCKLKKQTSTAPHLPFAAASATAGLVATRNGAEPFVLLWDTIKGRMLGKLDRQSLGVTSVDLSSDGKRALLASEDRHVRLYDVGTRQVLATFDTTALPFAVMSPDGKRAVIADGLEARVVSLP